MFYLEEQQNLLQILLKFRFYLCLVGVCLSLLDFEFILGVKVPFLLMLHVVKGVVVMISQCLWHDNNFVIQKHANKKIWNWNTFWQI